MYTTSVCTFFYRGLCKREDDEPNRRSADGSKEQQKKHCFKNIFGIKKIIHFAFNFFSFLEQEGGLLIIGAHGYKHANSAAAA